MVAFREAFMRESIPQSRNSFKNLTKWKFLTFEIRKKYGDPVS